MVTYLIMQAPILLFLKLSTLYLITRSTAADLLHSNAFAVLEVEATGGLGSRTGSKL